VTNSLMMMLRLNMPQEPKPVTSPASKFHDNIFPERQDFSLVLGGPLFQLLRRSHLAGDALELLRQRILLITLLAWLPLLVLSLIEGEALGGRAAVPFLLDIEVHVRFLIALPLLIIAELIVHQRMRFVVRQFLERNLIPQSALPRFERAIASAFRLRNSLLAEVLLIAFVYVVGILLIWRHYVALSTDTWYAVPTAEGLKLSVTGAWYGYVSLPIYQFLLVRWYYRMFIWSRFLWHVSRIELSIVPTHPDRVGGLGFLANTVYAFMPLAVAHGAMLAGPIANRIFYLGATLPDWKVEIGVLVVFLVCLVLGPLLVFAPQLAQAKRTGNREYGTLAERYVREFDAKWLRGGAPAGEPLVGSADIQSLADLANSFEVVRTMHIAPITRDSLLRLVAATLAPIVPLALTMMPFEELLRKLLGVLF
jgi:AcrR family transcriptional regulator